MRPVHRFSSEAYQGAGRGLGSARVLALHEALCGGLQPDLTVLLLPDVERALARARQRNERAMRRTGSDENRFEREGEAFYRRVHAAYDAIAVREPGRVLAIRGNGDIETVARLFVRVWLRGGRAAGRAHRELPEAV